MDHEKIYEQSEEVEVSTESLQSLAHVDLGLTSDSPPPTLSELEASGLFSTDFFPQREHQVFQQLEEASQGALVDTMASESEQDAPSSDSKDNEAPETGGDFVNSNVVLGPNDILNYLNSNRSAGTAAIDLFTTMSNLRFPPPRPLMNTSLAASEHAPCETKSESNESASFERTLKDYLAAKDNPESSSEESENATELSQSATKTPPKANNPTTHTFEEFINIIQKIKSCSNCQCKSSPVVKQQSLPSEKLIKIQGRIKRLAKCRTDALGTIDKLKKRISSSVQRRNALENELKNYLAAIKVYKKAIVWDRAEQLKTLVQITLEKAKADNIDQTALSILYYYDHFEVLRSQVMDNQNKICFILKEIPSLGAKLKTEKKYLRRLRGKRRHGHDLLENWKNSMKTLKLEADKIIETDSRSGGRKKEVYSSSGSKPQSMEASCTCECHKRFAQGVQPGTAWAGSATGLQISNPSPLIQNMDPIFLQS